MTGPFAAKYRKLQHSFLHNNNTNHWVPDPNCNVDSLKLWSLPYAVEAVQFYPCVWVSYCTEASFSPPLWSCSPVFSHNMNILFLMVNSLNLPKDDRHEFLLSSWHTEKLLTFLAVRNLSCASLWILVWLWLILTPQ